MHVLCRAPLCNLTALPSPRRCTGVTTSSVSSLAVCWTRTQSSKCELRTRRGRVSRVLFGGALLDALGLPGTRSFGPGVALLLITLRRRGPQPRSQAAASCVEGPTASPMVLPTVCAPMSLALHPLTGRAAQAVQGLERKEEDATVLARIRAGSRHRLAARRCAVPQDV